MKPRTDNPVLYRENVYKSWKIMHYVVSHVEDECFVAHLEPNPGVGYDCLSLVTRDSNGGLRVRFMLNRNGVNANVLDRVWDRFDEDGCETVARELIVAAGLSSTTPARQPYVAQLCMDVVEWIEKHRNEEFCVGPIGWPGGCRAFLELPRQDVDPIQWPITDHGPELSLGLGGDEQLRLNQCVKVASLATVDSGTKSDHHREVEQLAIAIACCSEIPNACSNKKHPCHKIVTTQAEFGVEYRQVPEAWAGNLEEARVLFVSSNPSISTPRVTGTGEDYPLAGYLDSSIQHPEWPTARVLDFQVNRLDQSRTNPFVTGNAQFLCADGIYRGSDSKNGTKASQNYWKSAIKQVKDLLDSQFDLSRDICMTEIVHCKSKGEKGVSKASGKCSETYLGRILQLSGSLLVLIGGAKARTQVHAHRQEWKEEGLVAWDLSEKFGYFRQGEINPRDHIGLMTIDETGNKVSKIVVATEQLSYASNKYRYVQSVIGEAAYGRLADYLRGNIPKTFQSREEVFEFLGL